MSCSINALPIRSTGCGKKVAPQVFFDVFLAAVWNLAVFNEIFYI